MSHLPLGPHRRLDQASDGPCPHLQFRAHAGVARLPDIGRFVAELRITCERCGCAFQFLGLQPGLDFNGPTVSLDGMHALLPMVPDGMPAAPIEGLHGERITVTS